MKKLLVLAAFMFIFSQLSAQENKNENLLSFGVSFGSSIPVGVFKNFKPEKLYISGAKKGLATNINLKIGFNKKAGLMTLISIFSNAPDTDKGQNEKEAISFVSSQYISKTLLVGVYYQERIFKNMYAEIRGGLGISNTSIPDIFSITMGNLTFKKEIIRTENATSIAANLGIGLKLKVSKKFLLTFYGDYYATKPGFFESYITDSGSFFALESSQIIRVVNIGLGFEYCF